MFSGKTEELINRVKKSNKSYKVFKPDIDTRNETDKIKSHSKIEIDATTIDDINEILNYKDKFDVIGIDEAQFFSNDIVSVSNSLANNGVRGIIAGLDMDFSGKPFGPMPFLMAIAEDVTKVHAICTRSGKMASYTHRIVKSEDLVLLGDTRRYEALSRREFIKAKQKKK